MNDGPVATEGQISEVATPRISQMVRLEGDGRGFFT